MVCLKCRNASGKKVEMMNDKAKDPVCGMQVSVDSLAIEYLGMHFAFCSQQCLDRFNANPHLYIGLPGEKAPVQKGEEIIKRRSFRLEQPLTDAEVWILREELGAMMGIKQIEVVADVIAITYDLLQATAEQIEARIGEVGVRLGAGWQERLQRAFVHYFEDCEVANLEIKPHLGHH
jgi:YHS domain-containing protein